MNRDELLKLIEDGDFYGLMLTSTRAWVQHDHPTAAYAVILAEFGKGLPALQIPIIPDACASVECPEPLIA